MSEDAQPVEIKFSQTKPRSATPRTSKRVVNVRPAVAVASNAAVAVGATFYAVAGLPGLLVAGATVAGGTAATVAKSRARAKKEAKVAARKAAGGGAGGGKGAGLPGLGSKGGAGKKATGSAARRAAATGATSARKAGTVRRAVGAVGKAAKATGKALGAPKRAASNARKALKAGGTGSQVAAGAKRRAQVAAALKGKKSSKMRGAGSALLGGAAGNIRKAWKKSGAETKKKKAAEAKRKEAAGKKAKQYSKGIRRSPQALAAEKVAKAAALQAKALNPVSGTSTEGTLLPYGTCRTCGRKLPLGRDTDSCHACEWNSSEYSINGALKWGDKGAAPCVKCGEQVETRDSVTGEAKCFLCAGAELNKHSGSTPATPIPSGGNAMSYSPMRAMLELAEEMTKAAQRWDPVGEKLGMRTVAQEFTLWPEVIKEVAKAARVISDKTADPQGGVPFHPLILSLIESVHRNQGSAVGTTDEIPALIKSLHRKQFEVLDETPYHANNDMWGYSANREAA